MRCSINSLSQPHIDPHPLWSPAANSFLYPSTTLTPVLSSPVQQEHFPFGVVWRYCSIRRKNLTLTYLVRERWLAPTTLGKLGDFMFSYPGISLDCCLRRSDLSPWMLWGRVSQEMYQCLHNDHFFFALYPCSCVLHSMPHVLWWKRPAGQSSCICPKTYPYRSSQTNDTNCSCPYYFPLCSWTLLHENRNLVTGHMELLLPLQSVKHGGCIGWFSRMMLCLVLLSTQSLLSGLHLCIQKLGHCASLVCGIPRFSVPTQ